MDCGRLLRLRWVWRVVFATTTMMAAGCVAGGAEPLANPATRNVLMPEPVSVVSASGELALTGPWGVKQSLPSARLDRAVTRMLHQMSERTGIWLNSPEAGAGATTRLTLEVKAEGEAVQTIDENESYRLRVGADGIRIEANTVAGAMHGMQTLLQLVQVGEHGYELPFVTIEDSPRFRWRGLMIDCGRHFEPIPVIKRMLDGMAAVKLNVFHWHLTDDQGFRMESRRFPEADGCGV